MAASGPTALLEVRGLRTRYHVDGKLLPAVQDVSFTLNHGETIGLVGESGCGKSATALSLMGLVRPPRGEIIGGEVLLDGVDLRSLSEATMRRVRGLRVAMIFQDPMSSLNPVMRVGDQIAEAIRAHRAVDKATVRRRVVELLESVGIPDAAGRASDYPHQFSGGMRQRVMIAMALSCDPQVLIADEPTTALDVTVQAQILALLARLRDERHLAMIMITHDLGVVAQVADRVMVMYAGRIVESGTVAEVFDAPRHPYTAGLLGSVPRLDGAEARLRMVRGAPPNLLTLPPGCPFQVRCDHSIAACVEERPELIRRGGHEVACWLDDGR